MSWFRRRPDLWIDPKRVNVALHEEERRAEDARDAPYKARVRYRMLLGLTSEQLAPLIQRSHEFNEKEKVQ